MKLNIIDGWFHMEVIDPQDVLLDRFVNPYDIQTGRRITHVGIYRTLSDIEQNELYDQQAVTRLKEFFATKMGLIIAGQNSLIVADRAKRMTEMGVPDVMNPSFPKLMLSSTKSKRRSGIPPAVKTLSW